jgi:hypothetical protein
MAAPTDMPVNTSADVSWVTALKWPPNVRAGLPADVQATPTAGPSLAPQVAAQVLKWHIPGPLRQGILTAVGRTPETTAKRRDLAVRRRLLKPYQPPMFHGETSRPASRPGWGGRALPFLRRPPVSPCPGRAPRPARSGR